MKILVHSGIWGGDCVEQCPLIQRIAEANPAKIHLRFLEREMSTGLSEELRIMGEVGFLSFASTPKMTYGAPHQETARSIVIAH